MPNLRGVEALRRDSYRPYARRNGAKRRAMTDTCRAQLMARKMLPTTELKRKLWEMLKTAPALYDRNFRVSRLAYGIRDLPGCA